MDLNKIIIKIKNDRLKKNQLEKKEIEKYQKLHESRYNQFFKYDSYVSGHIKRRKLGINSMIIGKTNIVG
jgi:hypothetical protein